MKSVSSRSPIRCLWTTRRGAPGAGVRQQRFLLGAALDQALVLEPAQHLARGGAGDAEHLGDPRCERGIAAGLRAVLPDREREEVDRLEVLVDRMALCQLSPFTRSADGSRPL